MQASTGGWCTMACIHFDHVFSTHRYAFFSLASHKYGGQNQWPSHSVHKSDSPVRAQFVVHVYIVLSALTVLGTEVSYSSLNGFWWVLYPYSSFVKSQRMLRDNSCKNVTYPNTSRWSGEPHVQYVVAIQVSLFTVVVYHWVFRWDYSHSLLLYTTEYWSCHECN